MSSSKSWTVKGVTVISPDFSILARDLLFRLQVEAVQRGRRWRELVTCPHHVSEALRLSSELLKLADEQRNNCDHDGCLLLDSVVRDCAWKIRQAAQQWRLDLDESSIAERR